MTITAGRLDKPVQLSCYSDQLKEDDLGDHIVLACAPKCASSFVLVILLELTEYLNSIEPYAVHGTPYEIHPLYMESLAK